MKPLQGSLIVPAWDAPASVGAACTTRAGGVSSGPWDDGRGGGGLNLGAACGDEPARVAANRARLAAAIGMPIRWLRQVHGCDVVEAGVGDESPCADAHFTGTPGVALAVLVADCLPVLFADREGTLVAAAHAGWRGLAAGILENTVARLRERRPDADLVAWLGPCIGPAAFEVGPEVRAAFLLADPAAGHHFAPGARDGKWLADLPALASRRLARMGIRAIGSIEADSACTVRNPHVFWSYRRDRTCGRMAALVWLRPRV